MWEGWEDGEEIFPPTLPTLPTPLPIREKFGIKNLHFGEFCCNYTYFIACQQN
ncbi:hypothetical protein H6G74_01490 [Nostoc spongiaeforme FACHB-130]|uniref:Uncharacterized protein n=1 Tax=Nostoc spongiaeforme FACHB-130 TaxID=1357510 RepID=A0ABR8FNV3_9NOSO|nr:hypothetical protein [Nostoc spongiaeforme FACHB-130]